ncbi:Nucleoside-diphosphatase uda-1 [Aphelenchoides besseyi]|nr:Nucleoside-diphosphatase uda-1 [Aphelenchoides besseyi]
MGAFTALFWLLVFVSLNRSGESATNETRLKIPRPAMNTRWIQKPVKEIKSCLSPDLEDERKTCRFYAAVIDAGSTGTRLHLFEFSHDTDHDHSPFKVEKEIKPGLSSFAYEPENAAVSIRGLISAARKVVPAHLWSHTPIVMKATAGLRLLPGDQADGILKEVEAEIQKSGLLMDDESVGILSGTDEGAYGWFTLNFLTDKLRFLKRNVKKTSVALDLGGGSTQITFVPENPSRVFTHRTPEKDFGHTLKVFGNEIRLFTHSYLGNGLVASRLGIGRLLTTEQSDQQHKMITHCFPANYTLKDWDYAGNAATPEAGYSNCLKSTKQYVKQMNVQPVAEIDEREIHAFAYFYDRAEQAGLLKGSEGKGKWIRVGDFAEVARHVCSLTATEVGTEDWRPWQCLDLCYIYSLLHDGYGLNDDKSIHMTVTPAVERHYPLVVCYSRMFYFENWQIALASLELYRYFGASLFNIPVISVINDLYKIFKSYEREGLVRLGHGVVMPEKMKGLKYNPNSEVEFFNQVISNSEYRTPEEFSIKRMMEHVYINDTIPNVGKSIVLSKRMNLGIMHHALQPEDIVEGYNSVLMTENDMLDVHLRNHVFNGEQEWAFKRLPHKRYYYDLMAVCYDDEKRKVRERDLTNCPNPLHCKPKVDSKNPGPKCVVLKSTYQHVQPVDSFHIYAPAHKWLSNEKNCLF